MPGFFGKDFFGGCWPPFPEFDYTQYVPLCKNIRPLYFQRHILLSCPKLNRFYESGLNWLSNEGQLVEITSKMSYWPSKGVEKLPHPVNFA